MFLTLITFQLGLPRHPSVLVGMRAEGGQQLLLLALMPKMLYLSLCLDSRVEGKCISALVTPSYHFVPNMLGIQCLQVNGSWLSVGLSAGLITTRPEAKCSSHREAQGAQALHRQQRTVPGLPHALHFVTSLGQGKDLHRNKTKPSIQAQERKFTTCTNS